MLVVGCDPTGQQCGKGVTRDSQVSRTSSKPGHEVPAELDSVPDSAPVPGFDTTSAAPGRGWCEIDSVLLVRLQGSQFPYVLGKTEPISQQVRLSPQKYGKALGNAGPEGLTGTESSPLQL